MKIARQVYIHYGATISEYIGGRQVFDVNHIFNKLIALVLIGAGAFVVWLEGDGTFLILALTLGVPLLFAKENWTTIEVREIAEDMENQKYT